MSDAPAPPPALVASAEGEPVTDLDHARYDRDGWMESALRAQGYVGELQGQLAAALARAERAEKALRGLEWLLNLDPETADVFANSRSPDGDDAFQKTCEFVRRAIALAHPAPAEET